MIIPRLLQYVVFATVLCVPICADAAEYSLREWHGEDGLPNEVIHAIAQDQQGYLWFAADLRGVARFNGLRFDLPEPVRKADPDLFVRSVVRHPDFGLLFSAASGEIWQWDGQSFRRNPLTDQFSRQAVQAWLVDKDGGLWAGFTDGKVEYLHGGRVVELKLDGVKLGRQPLSFAADGQGGVWIAISSMLFHAVGGHVLKITLPWRESELRVASSEHGNPWIMGRDFIGRWNGQELEAPIKVPEQLSAHYVRAILEDSNGNLWVGTRSQGAYVVTGDQLQPVPSSHRSIAAIFQDREGNIWFGTAGGGINRLQVKRFTVYDSRAGLMDDVSLSISEDSKGRMWFANRDGGIARVAKDGLEVMNKRSGWPNTNGHRVCSDFNGGVWFSGGAGLFRTYDNDDVRKIDTPGFSPARAMFVSRSGQLWMAGDTGGVARLDQNQKLTIFGPETGIPESELVSCFAEDSSGGILIGTAGGRLVGFTGGRFQPIRPAGASPLSSIRTILMGNDGIIWVGTAAGLDVILDGRDYLLTADHGLPTGTISQLLLDDHSAIWLGLPSGVARIERREILDFVAGRISTVHAAVFGKNEGFPNISCIDGYQPNCAKSRDGVLWFTTRSGVLAINPILNRDGGTPKLYIDELRVNDVTKPISAAARIPSDAHKTEVRFSVLNFSAPERTLVRYRLDGFDQEWMDAELDRKIVYPRLSPGSYVLKIETTDGDGRWGGTGVTLPLVVVPYWWQTIWLQIGSGLMGVILLVLGVRARSHRRLRRKLERAERESAVHRERTRIARDIHDELGASLTRISLLTQSVPEESGAEPIRSCFNEIYETTTDITRSIDEIVWAVDARHDYLESLVSYFDSYAQGFLSLAKLKYRLSVSHEAPELKVNSAVRHHLFLAFKEALNNCVKHALAAEVSVRFEIKADRLSIAVSDDGRGLSANIAPRTGGGNGFPNLANRMAMIKGELLIGSSKEGGTEVVMVLLLAMLNP